MASWSSSSSDLSSEEATEDNMQLLKELKKGDMVEFPRVGFSHWGVYVGNGEVVHLTMADDVISKGIVKEEELFNVAGTSKAMKNNDKDKRYKPLPPDTIIRNALKAVGKVGYNLLEGNCEHFASWCRYGEKVSDQADTAKFLSWFLPILRIPIAAAEVLPVSSSMSK